GAGALRPFYGEVFWGALLAIPGPPRYRRVLALLQGRRNLAALLTLFLCLVIVIIPITLITISLVREINEVVGLIRSGQLDFGNYFLQILNALPAWMVEVLDKYELGTLTEIRERLSQAVLQGSQLIATEALNIGQNTFRFLVSFAIMLYLL